MSNRINFPLNVALDTDGDPIAGAKLEFFESGTSTPLDTYTEETLTTANANPVIADSAGRFPDIFMQSKNYKVVLKDASDVTIDTWDPVGPPSVADFFQDIEGGLQATGSSNAYVVASNQGLGSLAAGTRITFIANHENTGAATLNVDSTGAKTIKKNHDVDLAAGDIEVDQIVDVAYKATEDVWQMLSPLGHVESGWETIQRQSASNSATIDFESLSPTVYEAYRLRMFGVRPDTDNQTLYLRVGTGATPTYQSANTDYNYTGQYVDPSTGTPTGIVSNATGNTDTHIVVFGEGQGAGNAADENSQAVIEFALVDNATFDQTFKISATSTQTGGLSVPWSVAGKYMAATAVTAIRVLFSGGNIAEGVFLLEGLRK